MLTNPDAPRPARDPAHRDGPFHWPDGAIVFSDTWSQWWAWQRAGAAADAWESFRVAPPTAGPVSLCRRGVDYKGVDLRGLDDGDEGGGGSTEHLPWPLGDEPDPDGPEFGA